MVKESLGVSQTEVNIKVHQKDVLCSYAKTSMTCSNIYMKIISIIVLFLQALI